MPETFGEFADAAKRCSDIIRLHISMGMTGKWAAIRLSDGGSDNQIYDTRRDAIRHQTHETLCAYVKIPADDMSPADAAGYLQIQRKIYDGGFRLTDPDGPEPFVPMRTEEMTSLIRNPKSVRLGYRDR